ncbi:MAG: LTA synthase family protein [Kofleriaceae bacterium]
MQEGRARWRVWLPTRWAWVYLLASPTSYLLALSLVATMIAKTVAISRLDDVGFAPTRAVAASFVDAAFLFALLAVLAVAERASRRLWLATIPIAILVSTIAIINAGYLSISGEQLTWPILSLGLSRFGDVGAIVSHSRFAGAGTIVLLALAVGSPIAASIVLRRAGRDADHRSRSAQRARAGATVALVTGALWLVLPLPNDYAIERLHANAVVGTYLGLASGDDWAESGTFTGFTRTEIVERAQIEKLAAMTEKPNILLVVLESTRREGTTLETADAPVHMPNLAALAARGIDLTSARAVLPYTTKSLWSMLCGRLPLMQAVVFEVSDNFEAQCLPRILAAAGWRTGFFQSAVGSFEDRPRLVNRFGFDHFVGGELLGEQLGYLGGDDRKLAEPFAHWLDEAPGKPFFATVLTSMTHHPYELPDDTLARARATGRPATTDEEKYQRLVEESDVLLGSLLSELSRRGIADSTYVIVVGDHGEGFGKRGVRQHASNFFEEGLRVPFVVAGPGIAPRKVHTAASLVDVTPTILDLVHVDLVPEVLALTPGRSVLRPLGDRVLPFGCFYEGKCMGYVRGTTKVVYVPQTDQAFAFALATDPDEHTPLPLDRAQRATLDEVKASLRALRTNHWILRRDPLARYAGYTCASGRTCTRTR